MEEATQHKFVSVKQLSALHPAFSQASIRWLLFHRHTNGAEIFVKRLGKKKLVIDLAAFEHWCMDNGKEPTQ